MTSGNPPTYLFAHKNSESISETYGGPTGKASFLFLSIDPPLE